MNRWQSQTGDGYMSQLKYAVLDCNFTNSGERIKDQFIKGISNQKYQEELLKVTSDNMPLDEVAKVDHKLEAVKLSTSAMQNLSTQVDAVNKESKPKPTWKRCQLGETLVEAEEVTGFIQGQQMEHEGTVVPSVKRDHVLPMGKLARIVTTRITLLMYLGSAKGRGLLASTITMVNPSKAETTIEETSEATMTATKATGVANGHAQTFMNNKLMISYRTSSKNKVDTTAMMILLMTQSLTGLCLNQATQWM